MAILTGFPPSNTISPSVRIAEKDLSFIAPEQSFHRAGMVGFSSKGPINIPVLIGTTRQLHTVFGYPHPQSSDPYLIYAAQQYLLIANELYIVRVADQDNVSDERANLAEVDIPSAGGQVRIISATAGPYTFPVDSFFRWKLNGILASKTLTIFAGTYSVAQLVEELNLQLDFAIDGIKFYETIPNSVSNTIGVYTTFSYGPEATLELVSVQDAIYGGPLYNGINPEYTNRTGLGTGMTFAATTGSKDRYPNNGYQTSGVFNFTSLSNLNLEVVVDGTDNVLIDNVIQVIDLEDLEFRKLWMQLMIKKLKTAEIFLVDGKHMLLEII